MVPESLRWHWNLLAGKKSARFLALLLILALLAPCLLLSGCSKTKPPPQEEPPPIVSEPEEAPLEILSYSPTSGAKGSSVAFELDQPVSAGDLKVYYGSQEIPYSLATDRMVIANVPLKAVSNDFKLSHKGKETIAAFTVLAEQRSLIGEIKASPSEEEQTITFPDGISVTLPANFLSEERLISVARVENAAVLQDSPLDLYTVYDVTVEGMEELPGSIQIGLPYDPEWFTEEYPVEDFLEPLRWDEKQGLWVDLFSRIDEETHTLYFLTDHLSLMALLAKSVSFVGLTKAALTVGAVAYGAEWLANDVYITPEGNMRILHSKKALAAGFPDDSWAKITAGGTIAPAMGHRYLYPFIVQDIGSILEQALGAYIKAGFNDPTKDRFGGSLFTRRVKVKIDSYYNQVTSGEFNYSNFWDMINIPTEVIRYEFYDPLMNQSAKYDDREKHLTQILAHELFHSIQRPFYGTFTDFRKGLHLWWMEASAEYASNDVAWGRSNILLNERIGNRFFDYPLNSTGKQNKSYAKSAALEYEYLSAIFIRFLQQKMKCNFTELVPFVAAKGMRYEPKEAILEFVTQKVGYKYGLDRLYADFMVWLIEEARLPVADFAEPFSEEVVAEAAFKLLLPLEEGKVIVEKEEKEALPLAIYKAKVSSDGKETMEPLSWLSEPRSQTEVEVKNGDVLYFIAPNAGEKPREVKIRIKFPPDTEAATSYLPEYDLTVKGGCTAQVWAVKVETGQWTINPEKLENANFGQKQNFLIQGEKLAQSLKEIRVEYDFGDGKAAAKGELTVPVKAGARAEFELDYTYEAPSDSASTPTYTLTVRIFGGEDELTKLTASISMRPVTISILPPRHMVYELAEGATEASHSFEAAASGTGNFRFDWDFGDGSPIASTQGASSKIDHVYKKPGQYKAVCSLYDQAGTFLGKDGVTVVLEKQEEEPPEEGKKDPPPPTSQGKWHLVSYTENLKKGRPQSDDTVSTKYTETSYSSDAARKSVFSYSVTATWDKPPQVLVPGEKLKLNHRVTSGGDDGARLSVTFYSKIKKGDSGRYKSFGRGSASNTAEEAGVAEYTVPDYMKGLDQAEVIEILIYVDPFYQFQDKLEYLAVYEYR